MYMITCSNKRFDNIPLTAEQFDVIDFIAFESETSKKYPFVIKFDDITMDIVENIINYCQGDTRNTDFVYMGCEKYLGCSL